MSESAQTSAGHSMSSTDWLDAHFETARAEYEDALRWVNIQPGWRVLDAGCGGGNYLPLMAQLAGPDGAVDAIDLAPENVARAEALTARVRGAPVTATLGSIKNLPFEADLFDCVWCAQVVQYLAISESDAVLAEFGRVLKGGGLLALKDADATHVQLHPFDPNVWARYLLAARHVHAKAGVLGTACGTFLPFWLRRAGFVDIKRRSWLIERWAPLAPHARQFAGQLLSYCASRAAGFDLPDADKRYWAAMAEMPGQLLDDPDFCLREVHVAAIGRKPVDIMS